MHRKVFRPAAVPAAVLSVILAVPAGIAAGPLLIGDFGKGLSAGFWMFPHPGIACVEMD